MSNAINISESNASIERKQEKIHTSSQSHSLYAKYHESEIDQNNAIIQHAIKMIWAGILILFTGLVFAVLTNQKIELGVITICAGAFVDIFSGTMIYLVNKSAETKHKYFENLAFLEHEQTVINLIRESNDEEFQKRMIERVVDNYGKK